MSTGGITMSQKELDRLSIIQQVEFKRIKQIDAANQLNLTTRHLRRLQKSFRHYGA